MEKGTNIFSGLEELGFTNANNIEVYKKYKEENIVKETPEITEDMLLYDKEVTCPVCQHKFLVRTVKIAGYRMKKKESDFYIKYNIINPYFYDVWVCNMCGYASMKADFYKLRSFEIESIQKNITPKWRGRKYPSIYDINISLERYKLSLLNYVIIDSNSSKKAINCLKISWLYREIGDIKNEELFRKQALIGLKDAYSNEQLPVYGMDGLTILYLIGELNRRSGNYDQALKYLGEVITSRSPNRKIKNLAIDQRDLIKETLKSTEENNVKAVVEESKKKSGLFSKLFKQS